jgi:hypothetical protein
MQSMYTKNRQVPIIRFQLSICFILVLKKHFQKLKWLCLKKQHTIECTWPIGTEHLGTRTR